MWRRCPRSRGAAPRGGRVPPSDSRIAPRAGGPRRNAGASEAHQRELVDDRGDAGMRGELFPKPAMPLLQVVEVSAKPHGVVLEGRGAKALDRGARFGGDPVAQLRAEVVEGRAHPLLMRAVGFGRWEGFRAVVVHSGLPFAGRERM